MTSLQPTTHQYASSTSATSATPFHILPSCRFHGEQQQQQQYQPASSNMSNGPVSSTRHSSMSVYTSSATTSNAAHDWNTVFHHTAGKLAYANGTAATLSSTTTATTTTTTSNSTSSMTTSTGSSTMLPLHTDPEMYALRSKYTSGSSHDTTATIKTSTNEPELSYHLGGGSNSSSSSSSSSSLPTVTVKQTQHVNNRLAYVEALVDTNAHVIETIWSSSSSHNKTAVVPLRTFIQEVLKRSRTTYSTLQTALFYLFRARPAIMTQLYERVVDQRASSHHPYWQDAYISCGRRMFLASLVIASKFVQDKTYRNSAWAKIAGLPVSEINAAERIFLDLIDYRLYIAQPTFEQWHHLLHLHVESRALNRPIPLLHDLSCLPTGIMSPSSSSPSTTAKPSSSSSLASLLSSSSSQHSQYHQQHPSHHHYQLPSPQSPTDLTTLPALTSSTSSSSSSASSGCCDQYHHHHHSYYYNHQPHEQHHQQYQQPTTTTATRRKRRLRETSIDENNYNARRYPVLSSPPSCSPSSSSNNGNSNSTVMTNNGYSPSVAISSSGPPPVLSLSLPSSSSSSPMHTPTQISPVRMNQSALPSFTWKVNTTTSPPPTSALQQQYGRPYMVSDVRQTTPDLLHSNNSLSSTCSLKKRRVAAAAAQPPTAYDYMQQGYAVSHVRGMRRKQQQQQQQHSSSSNNKSVRQEY